MQQKNDLDLQFATRIAAVAIDDRERTTRVAVVLQRKTNARISIERLPLGDYNVDDTLIVERKTLADFALSVRDGRLFTQVARLTRSTKVRTCLILEGTSEQYPRLAIPRPAFQGALISVTLVFGLPVLRSTSPEETADLILYAAQQLQRRDVRQPRRRGFRAGGTTRHQLLLLQAIPEIGPARAGWLLNAFGSPAGVAEATVESLEAVQGIGQHSAQRIYSVLHGTNNSN